MVRPGTRFEPATSSRLPGHSCPCVSSGIIMGSNTQGAWASAPNGSSRLRSFGRRSGSESVCSHSPLGVVSNSNSRGVSIESDWESRRSILRSTSQKQRRYNE
jgi:hypothetical protein